MMVRSCVPTCFISGNAASEPYFSTAKFVKNLITAVWARHVVFEMFSNSMKPFSNDEIIKECLQAATDVPFPVKNTSLVYLLYHDLAL